MPGKSTKEGKTPKPRKRSASNSSASSDQAQNHTNDDPGQQPGHPSNAGPRYSEPNSSGYYPPYRDDGQQGMHTPYMMPGQPPMQASSSSSMPPNANGMGMSMGPPQPAQGSFSYPPHLNRNPSGSVVENGHNHSSPSPSQSPQISVPPAERDQFSKILEQNAQIILQINQAIMENRQDSINEHLQLLGKNIQYLSTIPEPPQPPTHHSSNMPPPESVSPHHPARVSQSPVPVRPLSQGTPPHVSPPPGGPQQNGQFPQHMQYSGYNQQQQQQQQQRPQPVYSPLTQSTQGVSPRSPNVTFQNGPSRPQMYQQQQQGYPGNPAMGQVQTSVAMPPPMNYPYPSHSRAGPTQNYSVPYGYPGTTHEQPDPSYAAMPPPQMQPKRSAPAGYRPGMPQQGSVPDQRQMAYQPRMFSNAYAQDQQPQQQQVHYPGHHGQSSMQSQQMFPLQQQPMMSPVVSGASYAPSIPSGQYSMPQMSHGQFRTPAVPPPASPYGMPSPSGSTSSG